MAKKKKNQAVRRPSGGGPYVQIATFCDQVIEGKDGVLSAIRIVDRVYVAESARFEVEDTTAQMYLVRVPTLLVCLKSGALRGEHSVRLVHCAPASSRSLPPADLKVEFQGQHQGANIVIRFGVLPLAPGVHWFDVVWSGQVLSRIALEVSQRQEAT